MLNDEAHHCYREKARPDDAEPEHLKGDGTMCDFSLMDAIECGIVKLPRVPVADNTMATRMPMFRNLWVHVGKQLPRKGRGKAGGLDPLKLPAPLITAGSTVRALS